MNIIVLNGSPAGKNSITLYTILYIQQHFPEHHFEVLHVGQQIRKLETDPAAWTDKLSAADMVIFCYPVYTFLVPAQLHRFIELMKESGIDLSGKYATQVSTSKHFYDVTAHAFIRENCADLGLKYIRGLSADMDDLLHERGQREALSFFRYVLWNVGKGYRDTIHVPQNPFTPVAATPLADPLPGKGNRIVIVADFTYSLDGRLQAMCERLKNRLPGQTEIINIQEFPFAGGCLGCFHCAADGQCVYKDGFDTYLREHIQAADGLVYACSIKDHSMGHRFKLFDDRQFCNGHRTVTMGRPVAYLVDGALDAEPNLCLLMEARAEVGGNTLAGIARNQRDPDGEIDRVAETLGYVIEEHYQPPKNFYGVGGMMNNPKLRKKLGSRIAEGMIGPYKKVLEREPRRQ